jgi:hypothetical protein
MKSYVRVGGAGSLQPLVRALDWLRGALMIAFDITP